MTSRNPHALWAQIPPRLRPGLARWLVRGIPTGSFLEAVFRGDLFGAAVRGDSDSVEQLGPIALFVALFAPTGSKGEFMPEWKAAPQDLRYSGLLDVLECYVDFLEILSQEAA